MQQFFENTGPVGVFIIIIAAAWSLVWKGMALWKAARESDRNWFIALLIINTVGILDILYLYVFSKRRWHTDENASTLPTTQQ